MKNANFQTKNIITLSRATDLWIWYSPIISYIMQYQNIIYEIMHHSFTETAILS